MAFVIEDYALAKVEDVKRHLGISASDTTYDQLLTDLTNSASDWIENYCGGRRFASDDYVESYDSKFEYDDAVRQKWLNLKHYPVTDLTLVEYRTGTDTYSTVDTSSYESYEEQGQIYFYGGLPRGRKVVRVTYTAGYVINWTDQSAHTLPHDLTRACIKLVAAVYNGRRSQGVKEEAIGSWRIVFADAIELDDDIKTVLSAYKLKLI